MRIPPIWIHFETRIGFAYHMGILCWHSDPHMMSASATVFATVKRFITYRSDCRKSQIHENMLDYAYSARRFPPVILLNFFGGRINEPLKQTLRSIT